MCSRRISLGLVVIYTILALLFSDNEYFFYIGMGFSIFIIFLNVPFFVTVLHTAPIYYEDLLLISSATDTDIYWLQDLFSIFNGLFTSVFITLTIYYIIKYHMINTYSYIELMAIIGGLGSLNMRLQTLIGKGLLTILYKFKSYNQIVDDVSSINVSNNPTSISNETTSTHMDDISRLTTSTVISDLWFSHSNRSPLISNGSDIGSIQSIGIK